MKINKYSQKNNVNDLMMEAVEVQRSSTHSEDDFQENPKKNSRSASSTESDASHNSRGGEDETEERKLPMKCILRTVIFLIVAAILFGILFATGVLTNDDLSRVPILGDIDFEGFFDSGT